MIVSRRALLGTAALSAIPAARAFAATPWNLPQPRAWFMAESRLYQDPQRRLAARSEGDPVGAWQDLMGRAPLLLQSSPGNRPTVTVDRYGQRWVRFRSSLKQSLQALAAGDWDFLHNGACTIAIVYRPTASPAAMTLLATGAGSVSQTGARLVCLNPGGSLPADALQYRTANGTAFPLTLTSGRARPSTVHLLGEASMALISANGDGEMEVDGVLAKAASASTASAAGSPSAPLTLGKDPLADEGYLDGEISDILIYDRLLTPSEKEQIRTHLFTGFRIQPAYRVRTDACYNGFPSLALLPNGSLFGAYRKGKAHAGDEGAIAIITSGQQGRHWTGDRLIVRTPGIDYREPSASALSGNRIAITFWGNKLGAVPTAASPYYIQSTDGGYLWTKPVFIPNMFNAFSGACRVSGPAVELPDGRLAVALFGRKTGDPAGQGIASVGIIFSADSGKTWGDEVLVADGVADTAEWNEPNLLLLRNGDLLCLIRENKSAWICRARSTDLGRTWTHPEPVFSAQAAPRMIQLTSGTVVCVCRSKVVNAYNRAALWASYDDGETWTQSDLFMDATPNNMLYGGLVERAPGILGVLYGVDISSSLAEIRYRERPERLLPAG